MRPFEIRVPAARRGGAEPPALLLSAPTGADVDRIAEICQDPDIQEWTTVPRGYTRADAEDFVTGAVVEGWESGEGPTWAVREERPGGAVLVGMMGLSGRADGVWEIGYWLDPAARGRGTASRAARALVETAFDPDGPLRAAALRWRCDIHDGVPNWASWRVARGLGFRREGRVRSLLVNDGVLHDGWIGTLLPGDPRRPAAPWDGPVVVAGRPAGSSHARGADTPLVEADGVGEREGDDPEALVRRFHRLYGLPIRTDGPGLERESLHMRMSLIAEEFAELVGAVYGKAARGEIEAAWGRAAAADDGERDTVAAADALADLVYVVYGMALETGIDLAAVLAEVQRSNMSKLGADGRPVYRGDGKVLKGPDYFPPDVAGVLGIGRREVGGGAGS
ncbi:bifunctional GNAT family N-acetyltransferase/nucleoside triphosphate pyrophosphohydrolase family protein [uncultured Actinomyces sp.]|uniref:bifunctional GNAT family N-acetyltransferase/nucleoside triphosphate pyrophosphohydrolase family protein n=1 Tax=uncultured Actinomyces sp. TaxID=249061 RepID=UPI00288B8786|nr:bifunctional GNAT family N-acetyltransferase/nucleoside triphosphate pyrophosphohydrolase family protein [uncultured Actinomyces sp.]